MKHRIRPWKQPTSHRGAAARRVATALTFAILFAVAGGSLHAVTLQYPTAGNHIHMSVCPAADGINVLDPDPVENNDELFLLGNPSAAIQGELAGGDTSYAGWTFNYNGAALTGTFTVDEYKSQFVGNHNSGAKINMRYKKGAGDPAGLRWVQLIETSDPLDPNGASPPGPPTSPYIDPYPDDSDGVGGPFYYSDKVGDTFDYRTRIGGSTDAGFGKDYDIRFYDFPKRYHPPTSFVKWQAELWLTSANNATKTVTFHEGVQYGFQAACIHWNDALTRIFGTAPDWLESVIDPEDRSLHISPGPITVLNRDGDFLLFDPDFFTDPMGQAQVQMTPFQEMESVNLPPGLHMYRDGSIQVVHEFSGEVLFTADIPYLVLGDQLHPEYNMTGVYDNIFVNPEVPSPFLQEYEQFREQGVPPGAPPESDRSNLSGDGPDAVDLLGLPGHSPQFYARTDVPIDAFIAGGVPSPIVILNSFGMRDPGAGVSLKVDRPGLDWGNGLGPAVGYDIVRGDLYALRSSGGDFLLSTDACLANDVPAPFFPHVDEPLPGEAWWYAVRAVRGPIPGTWDTLQPSQFGPRDAGINLAPGACP